MRVNTPCKECHAAGNNYLGCHDKCKEYLQAVKHNREENRRVQSEKIISNSIYLARGREKRGQF